MGNHAQSRWRLYDGAIVARGRAGDVRKLTSFTSIRLLWGKSCLENVSLDQSELTRIQSAIVTLHASSHDQKLEQASQLSVGTSSGEGVTSMQGHVCMKLIT